MKAGKKSTYIIFWTLNFDFVHLIELKFLMMSVGKELFRNGQNTETFLFFENPFGIDSIRAHLNCGDGLWEDMTKGFF